jgi:stalled ribosome alternative rescue factor ArfA
MAHKKFLPTKNTLRREDTGRISRKFFNLKILKNSKLKGSYQRNRSQISRMFTVQLSERM